MQASDIPVKIDIPFATNAGVLKNQIPEAPPGIPGRASFSLGFPPENFQPIEAGGVPPFGQDMNGLMYQTTAWLRWAATGNPVAWDSAFSSEIGGYPRGAALLSANGLGWWLSTINDNGSNPDTGGGGWLFVPVTLARSGNPNGVVTGQAATSTSPPSMLWDGTNLIMWRSKGGTAWDPILSVDPVVLQTGNVHNYVAADNGLIYVRSNSGSAMTDALPASGQVVNGWGVTIFNSDASATLTLTCTSQINGVPSGVIQLAPRQSVKLNADINGNLWSTVPVVPQVFSGQAIYINTSGSYPPGVYDVDTSAGAITFQLELSGVRGDNYVINDVAGTFAANNCVIDPNGRTIEGQTGNYAADVSWTQFRLSRNTDTNWSLV